MGMVIDIIAILIIVIAAIIAYVKGFVKTFFGFISSILAIVLACMFCNTLSVVIKDNTEIDDFIRDSIISINEANNEKNEEDEESEAKSESFADTIPNTLNDLMGLDELKQEATTTIVNKICDVAINILSWLIIYAIVRIVLMILMVVFDGIMSLPILKTVNNLAGLILGAVMGVFRVYFVLAIVYFISNIANISGLVAVINTSTLTAQLYNHNLLINLIF